MVPPGGYGSGSLTPWRSLTRSISPAAQIQDVVEADGLFLFGDSIAVQDEDALAFDLWRRTSTTLAVDAWAGRPTGPAVDVLARWAKTYGLPHRILMATGTNDVFTPPLFGGQIDRVMRLAGPSRAVYWVNVHVGRFKDSTAIQTADQRNTKWINLQLDTARKRYPNLVIIRWAEFLAARPDQVRTYLRDGVHTTIPVGQDARNALIVDAIASA
ncbi:hypothetical protein GCM10009789_51540 [Kribbella sancticallisti]|uniref:SGNH hydrolase-type esterase domain-containing protein n=1 Tax=Kribbella sancticallisti TaxID=460087 RepID=A0ABP4PX43_9ACTN